MKTRILFALCGLALSAFVGCTSPPQAPSQDQVRERAADATAAVKRDTKSIAQGIKEGWSRDKNIDINSASRDELKTLPGIDDAKARLIIDHRPYPNTRALVVKKVLSRKDFDQIASKIQAK